MSNISLQTIHLQDWFRRLHAGDAAAADELLRAAGDRLERLARRMLQSYPNVRRHADTGDIFQEAVFRLLRSLRQLDTAPASVRDFLGLAATHIRRELLDVARRCGTAKRRGDVPLEAGGDPAESVDAPDELDRWQRFHEAVEKLPVEEREVISLRFYHGWSEADIAGLFGITDRTDRTVRRRWAAGCARLSEALGSELPTP